jgi:parallel beta-helix repeat protein
VNCTITGNAASASAGGLYFYDSSNLTLKNTILWADSAPHAQEVLLGKILSATSMKVSYSDIQNRAGSVVCESDCTVTWGPGNLEVDPRFVEVGQLSANNTRTGADCHLLEESPCIDAGEPDYDAAPGETDIAGNPRVSGAAVDIGAYEYPQSVAIAATVSIKPKTLNLGSNGKWVSCNIRLPDGYQVADIDPSKVVLNGAIGGVKTITDSYAGMLLVKFDREAVQEMLVGAANPVALTVQGELTDGTVFEGTDTIRTTK